MDLEFDNHDLVMDDSPRDYSPVPDGWYDARIMGAEIKVTKAGNGRFIACRYDIIGGDYSGRVIFGNITINNKSAAAEGIGRKQLSQIAMAGGLTALPKDSDELVGMDLKIKVTIRAATEQWPASNDVKDWKPMDGGSAMPTPPKKSNGATAPWANKTEGFGPLFFKGFFMNNKTNVLELTDSELGMLDELAFNGASELNYLFSQNQKDKVKKVMGKIEYALYLKMKRKSGKPNLHLDKLLGKIKGFE